MALKDYLRIAEQPQNADSLSFEIFSTILQTTRLYPFFQQEAFNQCDQIWYDHFLLYII